MLYRKKRELLRIIKKRKPDKIHVVFDTGVKYDKICLNDHLLKRLDLLNNPVSILMRFRRGEFVVLSDTE